VLHSISRVESKCKNVKRAKINKTSFTYIGGDMKICWLVPLFLGLAFMWSITSAILGDIGSTLEGLPQYIGFCFGNGIPRFAIYIFCIGFILYNYNDIVVGDDDAFSSCGGLFIILNFLINPLVRSF
jgi:hypothetical protein